MKEFTSAQTLIGIYGNSNSQALSLTLASFQRVWSLISYRLFGSGFRMWPLLFLILPSLTSALSVNNTFCPLMSLCITWFWWRWLTPWEHKTKFCNETHLYQASRKALSWFTLSESAHVTIVNYRDLNLQNANKIEIEIMAKSWNDIILLAFCKFKSL